MGIKPWRVIRTTTGGLAIVGGQFETTRPVIHESYSQHECFAWLEDFDDRLEQAKLLCRIILWTGAVVSSVVAIAWASGGYSIASLAS